MIAAVFAAVASYFAQELITGEVIPAITGGVTGGVVAGVVTTALCQHSCRLEYGARNEDRGAPADAKRR